MGLEYVKKNVDWELSQGGWLLPWSMVGTVIEDKVGRVEGSRGFLEEAEHQSQMGLGWGQEQGGSPGRGTACKGAKVGVSLVLGSEETSLAM